MPAAGAEAVQRRPQEASVLTVLDGGQRQVFPFGVQSKKLGNDRFPVRVRMGRVRKPSRSHGRLERTEHAAGAADQRRVVSLQDAV
jgi:hypothetical protein